MFFVPDEQVNNWRAEDRYRGDRVRPARPYCKAFGLFAGGSAPGWAGLQDAGPVSASGAGLSGLVGLIRGSFIGGKGVHYLQFLFC